MTEPLFKKDSFLAQKTSVYIEKLMKLSMIVETYNEEKCLPLCLQSMLPYVDECIIIDGSENGSSTDKTPEIINAFKNIYPEKIIFLSGTFRRDDGAWDETVQVNKAFELATGDFIMRTHADIIYDYDDMAKIRHYVSKHWDKKLFYCPMMEFFYDTNHIRLYPNSIETLLPMPLVGDVPVIAADLRPHFEDVGNYRKQSFACGAITPGDTLYMPHVKRYHFGWVKPFKDQVLKHVRYIMRGDHEAGGEELKAKGKRAMFDWAIEHVLSYKNDPSMFPYAGSYPEYMNELRDMTIMDGYEEFMEEYNRRVVVI